MVRSLDVQQVLLQSNAVERVQQAQQQQGDAQQRYFQARLIEEERELREKVRDPEESDRLTIRSEDEREKQERDPGKGGAKKEEREAAADTGEPEGTIDIRV